MRRLETWTLVILAGLLLLCACSGRQNGTASITVTPPQAEQGAVIRVTGKNWQPGERVVIALSLPNAAPEDAEPITDVLADASGSFVALFGFPRDDRWAQMREMQVVARAHDLSRVAVADLRCTARATATAVPSPAGTATWPAEPVAYLLGYVEDVSTSARTITVRPIEGQSDVIALVDSTQIICEEQVVQLKDIHVGDLVEASGRLGTDESVIADQVRILARAQAEATATPVPTPTNPVLVWRGEYYDNMTFSGNPSVVREDPVIDFQWQEGSPTEGLPADSFAVRWTGHWPFEAGVYRFNAQVDDGVRLWLDAHLIIDHWHESSGVLYSADAYLSTGSHVVEVEYFDAHGGAHAKLWWQYQGPDAVPTYTDWKGEYYDNATLSDAPFLVVDERALDFNWGLGAPSSGMPGDDFSARWTRAVNLQAGVYRFYAHVDDGVRLWVDDTIVIDEWQEGAARTLTGDLDLSSGDHNIRVEYYERTGHAVIKVWWELMPGTPTPTSTELPQPTDTPTSPPPTQEPTATATAPPPEPTATTEQTPTPEVTETPSQSALGCPLHPSCVRWHLTAPGR